MIIAGVLLTNIVPQVYATTSPSPIKLKVSVNAGKNPIMRGGMQTVYIKVVNSATGKPVKDVSITASIIGTKEQSITKNISGKTDQNGNWSFSWKIGSTSKVGLIGIDVKSSKMGYGNSYGSTFFKVIAKN